MGHGLGLGKAVDSADDRAMIKSKPSLPANSQNQGGSNTLDYAGFWQQKAALHFTNSAYKELKSACAKILIIPGQLETNAEALFYMGYACMRLHDYSSAMEYFERSYYIDSSRIALRLLMYDLQIIKKKKTLYKSNRTYTISK